MLFLILRLFAATMILPLVHALTWGTTTHLFVFGASFSSTILSGGFTTSFPATANGDNWPIYLTQKYNVGITELDNFASPGATIDNDIVPAFSSEAGELDPDLGDQVVLWKAVWGSNSNLNFKWSPSTSLFAIWMGANDLVNSGNQSNDSRTALTGRLLDSYFNQVNLLYAAGARSFVFLDIHPIQRTPQILVEGAAAVNSAQIFLQAFNKGLELRAQQFKAQHASDNSQITFFHACDLFNALLDNADALGFANVTTYVSAYQLGTPTQTTQIPGYKPASSYFWLNSAHPMWTVHDVIARALSTVLS